MTGYRGALDLSNELLHDILDCIAADDPGRIVSVDKRAYLSQESFRPDPLPSQDQIVWVLLISSRVLQPGSRQKDLRDSKPLPISRTWPNMSRSSATRCRIFALKVSTYMVPSSDFLGRFC
jgi:hypothetical protein